MIGPNLSEWALKRRSLVVFLMIVAVVAGTLSFLRLGRGEDPAITIRTMIVAAAWPGATVEETLKQVTERLERTLQETRPPRPGAQLHDGRADDDLRRPEAVDAAGRDPGRLVPGAQEHRRHARHAAAGRRRAVLQRRFRRHLRHHLRVHRRRLHVPRAARLRRGRALAPAAGEGRLEDRGAGRAGRAGLHRVLDRAARGPAARLPDHRRHAAGAEPRAAGRRHPDRAGARVPARHRRVRFDERDIESGQLRRRRPHLPAGRHRHRAARLRRPAAADVPRQRQAGDRPRDRDARRRRHPGARREHPQGDGRHQGQPARRHRARCWSPTRRSPSTSRSTTS